MIHYLSSAGLTQCSKCRRHVLAASKPRNTTCPFCQKRTGPLKGGALAIALLGLTACGTSQEPTAPTSPTAPTIGATNSSAEPDPPTPQNTASSDYEPASDGEPQPEYGMAVPSEEPASSGTQDSTNSPGAGVYEPASDVEMQPEYGIAIPSDE